MIEPNAQLGRRGLIASGLAGSAVLLAPAAHGQAAAPAPGPAPSVVNGQPVIDVNHARSAPFPIAIPDFGGGPLGSQIAQVITSDLGGCGLFRPLPPSGFIQTGASDAGVPDFNNWKATGAQALVSGQVAGGGNSVQVQFRLWDILQQTQIQGTAYTTTQTNWRRIAHIIADVIYQRVLGETGYFDTRIAYVSGTGPRNRQTKRLAIMDQDSENNRFLTDGRWLVLTPRWHPTRDEIAFMSYTDNRPRVYTFDLSSGRQQVLGDFRGMTFSPRFAPNGESVIMSVSRGGGSDIVTVDLASRREQQLTNSGAIDTSPCYSPDGTQIVFNSDRGGDQQLYLMGAEGGGAKRISFGNGRYATPVWSPRGDLIAFTRLGAGNAGQFAIGVMAPDGTGERILSESFAVEGPTFAPNGRVLMFWRETPARDSRGDGYSSRLVSIDITGFNERVAPTPTNASDPAWSPLGA